ncbi:MAG: hypothetical protein DKM23_05145 [Candidatus Melainabacteria bacterium]|nr:MAG: hypothetical protein DKM23_05145 [Candidatus Melainabacteria bacterium]RAI12081.1 MAG: hypothetical protein DKM24_03455 [Candidatus Melainabacteria bacterium]
MEIKTSLNKPYTENEKMNFIVKQNHNLGYNIVETDTTLEAWGKTEEEIQAEENENKKLEIQKQLDELDKKRIRAVCEPSMKTETQSWLDYYNEEIKKLREML